MFQLNPIRLAMGTLALAGLSQAWLLSFKQHEDCTDYSDSDKGGQPGQTNDCMTVMPNIKTMRVKDWDPKCRIKVWGANGDCYKISPKATPYLDMTKEEAVQDSRVIDVGGGVLCFKNNLLKEEPHYAAYVCE